MTPSINFDPASLITLNILIAAMMFGVSLTLRPSDFHRIVRAPRAPVAGLLAQFLLLPLSTCLLTWWLEIDAQLALGMILIASCPGGSFSNVMTWLGRGNVAVSVSMTAISSLAATVLTPLNFAFYGWLNPLTREYLMVISLQPENVLLLVVIVLGIPLILGMTVGARFPRFAERSERPLRFLSLVVFLVFVAIAFSKNLTLFVAQFNQFFWLVVGHNLLALALGFGMAKLTRLSIPDQRAVTMEVGIQNSALGITILFTFFPQAGGMMLIAAFWGVWHIVSGLTLSQIWARQSANQDQALSGVKVEQAP